MAWLNDSVSESDRICVLWYLFFHQQALIFIKLSSNQQPEGQRKRSTAFNRKLLIIMEIMELKFTSP
ncbi:MAG: hypothetical protein QNJ36_15870 [Calothrix sp. MO_167.B42]|nr:hypothetical protein [Calothrix sp. MO_167.B42]